jgi:LacI family transcriptional regulator
MPNSSSSSNAYRILICTPGLSGFSESQVQMGINRFAITRQDWQLGYLDIRSADDAEIDEALGWRPHGILAVSRPEQIPEIFGCREAVVVHVDLHMSRPEGVSRVEMNNRLVGRRAAEYFLRNRFEQFGFVTSPKHPQFSREREQGFTEALEEKGLTPQRFQLHHSSGKPWYSSPELNEWLKKLPKPVAIYCVQDLVAQRVMEQCRPLGIRVPAEVSLLGTDNHRVLCKSFRPYLSSIPQSLELMGFRAAELLAEQIEMRSTGGVPEPVCRVVDPGEVVERQSTSLRAIPDPAIAAAANYLHDHALKDGTIAQAAREGGLNRRAMERGFKKHLGVTPGQYMNEVRLDHAKRLLRETDLRMAEIAEACRMTQEYFAAFFRKTTGQPPSDYRREKRRF